MGRPGPSRKPSHLHLANGNPGHKSSDDLKSRTAAGGQLGRMPPAPKYLGADGKKEWKRLGPMLRDAGLLSHEDLALFTAYCVCWDRAVSAERALQDAGTMTTASTRTGYEAVSPLVTIANQAWKELRQIAAEFGLSPSGRSRFELPARPDDKKDKFFD